jgi:leucyl aminopeptidase
LSALFYLTEDAPEAVPVAAVGTIGFDAWLRKQPGLVRDWLTRTRFRPEPGKISLIPGSSGDLARVVVGTGEQGQGLWTYAGLPGTLPEGHYRIEQPGDKDAATKVALGWALGCYAFARYNRKPQSFASLVWPAAANRKTVARAAEATELVRNLINTPAGDMGPEELADAARTLGREHKARTMVSVGETLLKRNFPAIHAVGRASTRAPRLIDMTWGEAGAPRVTLVGKGVCFDTGGLDIKPATAMKLMKKDMGGAATVLGLAAMIMDANLPVRLRVLIPAVENAISGNALYPMDVVTTRKGLTVEIGNTDAEGRVVLADALTEASRERPEVLLDFATLTGAARVALGPELPALFANDDALAKALTRHAEEQEDPVWRLPLWKPYGKLIEGKTADLTNAADSPHGGAITAALFLQNFVGKDIPWAHFDIMAWNVTAKPGRPEGGEAMAMRAAFAMIEERFSGK